MSHQSKTPGRAAASRIIQATVRSVPSASRRRYPPNLGVRACVRKRLSTHKYMLIAITEEENTPAASRRQQTFHALMKYVAHLDVKLLMTPVVVLYCCASGKSAAIPIPRSPTHPSVNTGELCEERMEVTAHRSPSQSREQRRPL